MFAREGASPESVNAGSGNGKAAREEEEPRWMVAVDAAANRRLWYAAHRGFDGGNAPARVTSRAKDRDELLADANSEAQAQAMEEPVALARAMLYRLRVKLGLVPRPDKPLRKRKRSYNSSLYHTWKLARQSHGDVRYAEKMSCGGLAYEPTLSPEDHIIFVLDRIKRRKRIQPIADKVATAQYSREVIDGPWKKYAYADRYDYPRPHIPRGRAGELTETKELELLAFIAMALPLQREALIAICNVRHYQSRPALARFFDDIADARSRIMEKHVGQMYAVAQEIYRGGVPRTVEYVDLVQEATFGLINAIHGFNPSAGVKFKTFASTCIRNHLISLLRGERRHTSREERDWLLLYPEDEDDEM